MVNKKELERIKNLGVFYEQGVYDVLLTLNIIYGKKFVGEFLKKAEKIGVMLLRNETKKKRK